MELGGDMPQKPKLQREVIDQLWFCIIGTDGDGLVDHIKNIEKRLNHFVTYRALAAIGGVLTLLFGSGFVTKFLGIW